MSTASKPPKPASDAVSKLPPSVVLGSAASSWTWREDAFSGPGFIPLGSGSHLGPTVGRVVAVSAQPFLQSSPVAAGLEPEARAPSRADDSELLAFIRGLRASEEVHRQTVDAALSLWVTIREALGDETILPIVQVTHEQQIQFVWRNRRGVVSVDVGAGGECDWFGRLRATERYWEAGAHLTDPPPQLFFTTMAALWDVGVEHTSSAA